MSKRFIKLGLNMLVLLLLISPIIFALVPEKSTVPTEEPPYIPQQYSFADEFVKGLFSIDGLTFIMTFLFIAIIPLFFVYYTIKNKENKKKSIFALISAIILTLDYIIFVWLFGRCIAYCDGFVESFIGVFVLLPIAGIVIIPWIIYWTYSYFKNK